VLTESSSSIKKIGGGALARVSRMGAEEGETDREVIPMVWIVDN
jgi:hypothetical protein